MSAAGPGGSRGAGWTRPVRPGWWLDAVLVAGVLLTTVALAAGGLLGLDVAVRDWCDTYRPDALYWIARAGNLLGQGTPLAVLCLAIAAWLGWRRHSVRPVLPVLAAELLTLATIGPLKLLTRRAAPHGDTRPPFVDHPERLFSQADGVSYPSGHLANAIVWYGVLALLLAPWLGPKLRAVLRIVPPAVLSVTTVYLGFHWVTDTIAGLLLGIFLDRLMHRVRWDGVPLGRRVTAAGWARPGIPYP